MDWIKFIPKADEETRVFHELLTERKITEEIVTDFLALLLARKGWWTRTRINLWKLIEPYVNSLEVLDRYDHPLQPDIDILQCAYQNTQPRTPLIGIEVKVFSKLSQMVVPKVSSGESGYYAGIGQALSLLTYGLDYSYLWQVFLVPFEDWEKEPLFLDDVIKQNVEWTTCYGQFIEEVFVNQLHLPIGYKATAISVRKKQEEVAYLTFYNIKAKPSHIASTTFARLRVLLTEKLGIEETFYQKRYLQELIDSDQQRN